MRPTLLPANLPHQRGFTLVEAIVVIMLTGIIAGVVAVFMQGAVKSYLDTSRRAELTDIADTAARRIARDIQGALPNSVRVDAGNAYLELVPIKAAGRYRAEIGLNVADDPLDFSNAADNSFDVLVDANEPSLNVANGDSIVIFNMGQTGANVYDGSNVRAFTSFDTVKNNMVLASGGFPFASPDSRFQVVNSAVTYACDLANSRLMRYSGYAIPASQPVNMAVAPLSDTATTKAILATHVTACSLAYSSGVLERNGLVTIHLAIGEQGETVNMVHQVDVVNTP